MTQGPLVSTLDGLMAQLGLGSIGELEALIAERRGVLLCDVKECPSWLWVSPSGEPAFGVGIPATALEIMGEVCPGECPVCAEHLEDGRCAEESCAFIACPHCPDGSGAPYDETACAHLAVVICDHDVWRGSNVEIPEELPRAVSAEMARGAFGEFYDVACATYGGGFRQVPDVVAFYRALCLSWGATLVEKTVTVDSLSGSGNLTAVFARNADRFERHAADATHALAEGMRRLAEAHEQESPS